ncbi:MAG: isoprenylcysteine carboxylmethyltransferase family protein [Actinobacteria bacterium]|nr:isoprenylcysteine carboxylmethyltransferase family protein [Actinomycetota bacterium]
MVSIVEGGSNVEVMKLDRSGVKGLIAGFMTIIVQVPIMLLAAGRFFWVNAWIYTGFTLIIQIVYTVMFVKIDPGLLNERGHMLTRDTRTYDKIFYAVWRPLIFTTLVIAGLDAVRYEWSHMPAWLVAVGYVIYIFGAWITLWAMLANSNFIPTVIADKPEQQVCSTGPYAYIRHPGYVGLIVCSLAVPLILGSWWALLPAAGIAVDTIFRTYFEDRTIQLEIPGYKEFTRKTRYRLVPGIW